MWQWLLNKFDITDPSDYEDFYTDLSWKTFRLSDDIWSEDRRKRPGIGYFRSMQHCYQQLLEEMSDSFLYDVEGLKAKFNEMHIRNCDLERQLAIANGNIEILQRQLTDALKWQTQTGRKNEVYESQGMETIKPTQPEKSGNRFSSRSGSSLMDNQMLAAAYYENGWELPEIAEELKVSEGTVKVYVSGMQKHYEVKFIQGRKHICFDSDYGSIRWDLCLFERLSVKFPTADASAG